MFNIGAPEIALILVAALLILGPKRLPELARGIGKFLREFRRQTDEVRSVVEREFYKMDHELDRPVLPDAAPPPELPPGSPYPQGEVPPEDPGAAHGPDGHHGSPEEVAHGYAGDMDAEDAARASATGAQEPHPDAHGQVDSGDPGHGDPAQSSAASVDASDLEPAHGTLAAPQPPGANEHAAPRVSPHSRPRESAVSPPAEPGDVSSSAPAAGGKDKLH